MDTSPILKAFKAVLPLILGAVGGIAAATFPAYHAAFCSGGF